MVDRSRPCAARRRRCRTDVAQASHHSETTSAVRLSLRVRIFPSACPGPMKRESTRPRSRHPRSTSSCARPARRQRRVPVGAAPPRHAALPRRACAGGRCRGAEGNRHRRGGVRPPGRALRSEAGQHRPRRGEAAARQAGNLLPRRGSAARPCASSCRWEATCRSSRCARRTPRSTRRAAGPPISLPAASTSCAKPCRGRRSRRHWSVSTPRFARHRRRPRPSSAWPAPGSTSPPDAPRTDHRHRARRGGVAAGTRARTRPCGRACLARAVQNQYERDWPAARRSFRRAVALAPKDAFVHSAYGCHLVMRGLDSEAERELTVARELDPLYVNSRAHLANLRIRQGRLDDARAELDAMLDIAPASLGAHGLAGLLALARGEHEQAVSIYAKLCDSMRGPPRLHRQPGRRARRRRPRRAGRCALADLHDRFGGHRLPLRAGDRRGPIPTP